MERIKSLCAERDISLQELLRRAGVSPNTYYTLARHESVLPKSILAVARCLNVSPSDLLTEDTPHIEQAKLLLSKVDSIVNRHRNIDRDNVRHTLLLLEEKPIDRLRRALIRGRRPDIQ